MRALTDLEKATRRDRLASAALAVFQRTSYAKLTVDEVAREAGVSKGSVFLFFGSKEELVLHAVGQRFTRWLGRLEPLVPEAPGPLAQAVAATLRDDPLLLPLLALVGPVLEQGCDPTAIIRFKETLAAGLARLATRWGSQRPEVSPGDWMTLFQRIHALIVGAWTVGESADHVRGALEARPELQRLLTRFEDLLLPLLEAQFRAFFGATML